MVAPGSWEMLAIVTVIIILSEEHTPQGDMSEAGPQTVEQWLPQPLKHLVKCCRTLSFIRSSTLLNLWSIASDVICTVHPRCVEAENYAENVCIYLLSLCRITLPLAPYQNQSYYIDY
jgi:hypothetical protein